MAGSFVGIDVGNGNCKLAVRDGGMRLISVRTPENIVNDENVTVPDALVQVFKEIRSNEHIRQRDCALVLSEAQAFFRHVTLPAMTAAELKLNLPYEFRDYLEGDPGDYTYDYAVDELVTGEDGKPERLELYAAATRRDLVENAAAILRKAGFRLKVVIPAPMAYARLLRFHIDTTPIDDSRSVVFVDFGYSNVSVTLFRGARFQAYKTIDLGTREIDAAIADLKGIDRYTASSYKNGNFEGVLDSPECQAIYDRLCVEVTKVVNFYNFSNADQDVEQIYLLGGGAQMPQVVSAVKEAFSVPVSLVDELFPAEAQGQADGPVCALALAALLEGEAM